MSESDTENHLSMPLLKIPKDSPLFTIINKNF